MWQPSNPKLEDWFEKKIQEFSLKENISKKMFVEDGKHKYIFTEVHEIFFVTFTHEL